MPCLQEGGSRKFLGSTFNKHEYPFRKIRTQVNEIDGVLPLQDLLQAGMTGTLLMGYHSDRAPHFIPGAQQTTLRPHLPTQLRLCHSNCALQQTLPAPRKNSGQVQSECQDQPHAYQMAAVLVFTREKGSWPSGAMGRCQEPLYEEQHGNTAFSKVTTF